MKPLKRQVMTKREYKDSTWDDRVQVARAIMIIINIAAIVGVLWFVP